jgi:hypothetical protein
MLKITHNAGFFSCCSVKILSIINYFKEYKKLPLHVDSSLQFDLYKEINIDITYDFFENYDNINFDQNIENYKNIEIMTIYEHISNYKKVDYKSISPFVKKYFTPSIKIKNIYNNLIEKYNIDTENCIGLYYRGTDKKNETVIDSFDSYYNKLNEIINIENNIKIIIQTDSAQFLDYIKNKNLNNIIIISENTTSYTDKGIHNEKSKSENYIDIQNLFATFLIISKCKYIICSSGNCSIWMMYYRENDNNVFQNLDKNWL